MIPRDTVGRPQATRRVCLAIPYPWGCQYECSVQDSRPFRAVVSAILGPGRRKTVQRSAILDPSRLQTGNVFVDVVRCFFEPGVSKPRLVLGSVQHN